MRALSGVRKGVSPKYFVRKSVKEAKFGFCHFMVPGPMAQWLCPYGPGPTAPYSCFKNFEKWRCSVFVNLYVLRALLFQPVFSIFEFYAGNYAFVFSFEY